MKIGHSDIYQYTYAHHGSWRNENRFTSCAIRSVVIDLPERELVIDILEITRTIMASYLWECFFMFPKGFIHRESYTLYTVRELGAHNLDSCSILPALENVPILVPFCTDLGKIFFSRVSIHHRWTLETKHHMIESLC